MSVLRGIWKGTHSKYEYEFDFYEDNRLSTNAFSGWRRLYGPYKIDGNKFHFKGENGSNTSTGQFVTNINGVEAVFEFEVSGKDLMLKRVSTEGTDCIRERVSVKKAAQ